LGFFSGSKTTVPATGFYSQPQGYQDLYNNILGQTNQVAGSGLNTQAFTPLPMTQGEQSAISRINQGTAPTAESLQADLAMLQNPFDEYVIQDLNRQAQGQNSLVNQAGAQAGQMGSNRNFLQTSDVEQQRLNNIGGFRQSQYNTAINQALGPLAGLKQQDLSNAFLGGEFERGLDSATKQAPYAALSANQAALAGVPTEFGNFGSKEYTVKSGGGIGSLLKTVAPLALNAIAPGAGTALGAAMGGGMGSSLAGFGASTGLTGGLDPSTGINWSGSSFFSDERLKCDIEPLGQENGYNVYTFRYKGDDKKYKGVIAQEVEKLKPEAVVEISGYKAVNYDMLGVKFEEVA